MNEQALYLPFSAATVMCVCEFLMAQGHMLKRLLFSLFVPRPINNDHSPTVPQALVCYHLVNCHKAFIRKTAVSCHPIMLHTRCVSPVTKASPSPNTLYRVTPDSKCASTKVLSGCAEVSWR